VLFTYGCGELQGFYNMKKKENWVVISMTVGGQILLNVASGSATRADVDTALNSTRVDTSPVVIQG